MQQKGGIAHEINKSLDELVNEDTSMRKGRGMNQGQGQKGNGSFQKRNNSKGRDGEGGQRGDRGNRRWGKGDDRRGSGDFEQDGNYGDQRQNDGRRLFVSNLTFETQWKYLKDHMRQAGDVVRADIFEDDRGRSRGIGYVQF